MERRGLNEITAHIVGTYHARARDTSGRISGQLAMLASEHRDDRELSSIRAAFAELADTLAAHMRKEEHILFPYIDELAEAARLGQRLPTSPFGTVLNPIRVMEAEHAALATLAGRVRVASNDLQTRADATSNACLAEVREFAHELQQHMRLESQVLFPQAIELEQRLT